MHPREVPEVGEVFHLAGSVAAPAVRPGRHDRPLAVFQLRNLGQRPPRCLERDPDQPVPFLHAECPDPGLGRDHRRILFLRNRHTPAVSAIAPAVVGTHQFVALDRAQRQRDAAVHAQIGHRPRRALGPAPDDQRLTEQVGAHWAISDLAGERDGMPARALSGQVREYSR
jgi:hypothetical protein